MKNRIGLLIAYNGTNYHGLQFNSTYKTIDSEIIKSLLKFNAIKSENAISPQKIGLTQTSRTDKGVHAAMALLTCKIELKVDDILFQNLKNDLSLKQIHLYKIIKLSARFNPRKKCTTRVYEYYLPTFVLNNDLSKEFITKEKIDLLTNLFKKFEGTHLFHNFTASANDCGTQRYIKEIIISEPIVQGDNEYVKIILSGNSFLLHQIRKMVGYVVALMRYKGRKSVDIFDQAFDKSHMSIPKAPSKFLLLEHQQFLIYNSEPTYEKIEVNEDEKMSVKKGLIEPEIFREDNLRIFEEWFIIFKKHFYNFGYLDLKEEI